MQTTNKKTSPPPIQPSISNHTLQAKKVLEKYGLTITQEELAKIKPEQREEIIKEKIQDFLKNEYDTLYEQVSESRKSGKDHFIEELKMTQLRAKQRIALSTFDAADIDKYMILLKNVTEHADITQTPTETQ